VPNSASVNVFQGLFMYLAFSSFIGNQMFDRMLLFLMEGVSSVCCSRCLLTQWRCRKMSLRRPLAVKHSEDSRYLRAVISNPFAVVSWASNDVRVFAQSSYPPNHYVRKVPQRKIHIFTLCQIAMLLVVSGFGFAEQYYFKMIFPVVILLLLPIRLVFIAACHVLIGRI